MSIIMSVYVIEVRLMTRVAVIQKLVNDIYKEMTRKREERYSVGR